MDEEANDEAFLSNNLRHRRPSSTTHQKAGNIESPSLPLLVTLSIGQNLNANSDLESSAFISLPGTPDETERGRERRGDGVNGSVSPNHRIGSSAKGLNSNSTLHSSSFYIHEGSMENLGQQGGSHLAANTFNGDPKYGDLSAWTLFLRDLCISEYETSQVLKRERVYNFIHVPEEMEKMMGFGYLLCLDSFLTMMTVFPVRVFIALYNFFRCFFQKNGTINSVSPIYVCDLLKALIYIIVCFMLNYMDASTLYHSIRGQAVIKLYVIFNVLEIFDRMCCSFGQDILDSFLSRSIRKSDVDDSKDTKFVSKTQLNPFTHFILSVVYVFIHSIILFYQAITLNVAINSYNNSLLTLLVSNQFVEIKSAVFKKFEKENLFQLACSDVVERFQLSVYLLVIVVRNLIERGSSGITFDYLYNHLFPEIVMVFLCEILVDWLKHAFITKFNFIRPTIYSKFIDVLCKDMIRREDIIADHSITISRRIGFSVLPLLCFVTRIAVQTISMLEIQLETLPLLVAPLFGIVVLVKVNLGLYILRFAMNRCKNLDRQEPESSKNPNQHVFNVPVVNSNKFSASSVSMRQPTETLDTIDRFTLFKSRIP